MTEPLHHSNCALQSCSTAPLVFSQKTSRVESSVGTELSMKPMDFNVVDALSVDVEDYFQVEAFASSIRRSSWSGFQPRVRENTFRILELFARHQVKATFFVLGWIAERNASLIREIVDAG